jgi:hypothetical protein
MQNKKRPQGVVLVASYNMETIEFNCSHDINGTESFTHFLS